MRMRNVAFHFRPTLTGVRAKSERYCRRVAVKNTVRKRPLWRDVDGSVPLSPTANTKFQMSRETRWGECKGGCGRKVRQFWSTVLFLPVTNSERNDCFFLFPVYYKQVWLKLPSSPNHKQNGPAAMATPSSPITDRMVYLLWLPFSSPRYRQNGPVAAAIFLLCPLQTNTQASTSGKEDTDIPRHPANASDDAPSWHFLFPIQLVPSQLTQLQERRPAHMCGRCSVICLSSLQSTNQTCTWGWTTSNTLPLRAAHVSGSCYVIASLSNSLPSDLHACMEDVKTPLSRSSHLPMCNAAIGSAKLITEKHGASCN